MSPEGDSADKKQSESEWVTVEATPSWPPVNNQEQKQPRETDP